MLDRAMETAIPLKPFPSFSLHQAPQNLHHHLQIATTLSHVKQIHAQILRSGLDRSTPLLLKLAISSFAFSNLDYSLAVFHQIPDPDTGLYNRVLQQLSRGSRPHTALHVYGRMRRAGVWVDRFTFPPLLKASARASALQEAREIHGVASKMGFDWDPYVQTGLIRVYASCGRVSDARMVFERMPHRDVVAWSFMMDGCSYIGLYDEVLQLFDEMKGSSIEPDEVILATVLSACGRARNLNYGKAIHRYILQKNFVLDAHLRSSLITMYANCGSMDSANELYNNNTQKDLVVSTAMISGYSKLRKLDIARSLFNQMPDKDLISWSAMISGYAESDHPNEALKLFNEMQISGIKPDQITMLSVISACAHLGALDQAKWIHIFVDKNGFSNVLSINNALIDMYAKCGCLENAHRVFNDMPQRNVISWTGMITGLAMHGDGKSALRLFNQMKAERVEPNEVTFVGVLYACSHAGLVDDGRQIFTSMISERNIMPRHEHYGCMVDLLGRANLLNEAVELIDAMPFEPNVVIWGSLLAACRVHGNVELGAFAANKLLERDPSHDGAYVLLSNIYAKAGRFEDVWKVRTSMRNRGITKEKGCSWIEMDGEIHEFLTADQSHSKANEIYRKLDQIVSELKVVGYLPNVESVLVDMEDEEKKDAVLLHSEKLAVAFGLLDVRKGSSCIRIVKNLRVCEDCHSFMKLISKVYEREIVVRDRTRFHHYRDGVCSCKDFW